VPPTWTAQPGYRFAPARLASVAGRLARRQSRGAAEPGKSPGRGGFDPGTPRGGSIGLMRAKAARSRASVQPPPHVKSAAPSPWRLTFAAAIATHAGIPAVEDSLTAAPNS
jgi:hypothetical protein